MDLHTDSKISHRNLITDLQSFGLRLADSETAAPGRRGGAGPSDHRAIILGSRTVMVPVYTGAAKTSPFAAILLDNGTHATLTRDGVALTRISFPRAPRFYAHETFDGVPYWKIAQLHGQDVLATTILQTCIRYADRATSCQFCAIGQSLDAGRTIARKTPEQLAEVARMAVLLDGVRHMVMTTGTPNVVDRGAAILCDSAFAVKAAIDLPIQGQCEPPRENAWFARMKSAGIDTLGMHLEAVTPAVRARIMPGKASVSIERYLAAFAAAVPVFGRGQVSTYILARHIGHVRKTRRPRCLSLRGAIRADRRHTLGGPSAADSRCHAIHIGAPRRHARFRRLALG
jgi:radical SAM protein (TIGR04043 family)